MLAAAILASLLSWVVFRVIRMLPATMRARQLMGTADELADLAEDVDPARDHIRGSAAAPVTLVEYGDYECPYCGEAEVVIRELLDSFGDELRYVWRHLPLNDVHPNAQVVELEYLHVAAEIGRHESEVGRDVEHARVEVTHQPMAAMT